MPDSAFLALSLFSSLAGFGWLALAMDVHWQQVRTDPVPRRALRRTLRILGACGIVASLALCLAADHGTIASLVWFMLMTASALSVAFLLSWRPQVLSPLVWWVARR